jgi:2-octaprenyl-6-methoxyphenol hydroxylase
MTLNPTAGAHDASPGPGLAERLPAGLRLAVIGAGPVGLALALQAAQRLPTARIAVYDALPANRDVSGDARTVALSLGSVQALQRLGVWAEVAPRSQAIAAVHVSQQQPALLDLLNPWRSATTSAEPEVLIRAADVGVAQLGAVVRYGALVAPMRRAWLAACARSPGRLSACFGQKVADLVTQPDGVVVRVQAALPADNVSACEDLHDLAVIAEGGVFADQARKGVHHDYGQTAWVGTVTLEGGEPGVAYERFTPHGPLALLPLPALEGQRQAALVWCVATADDPVPELGDAQRLAVLADALPRRVGVPVAISPLKSFPLGLNAERQLVQGRTVRIGNAAQTLHPVAGQGLNLGLRDGQALLQALAPLRPGDGTALEAALARAAWQRTPDRWALIAATDFLARSFTWDLPGLSTLRGAGLAAVQRLPGLKGLLARQMMFGRR